MKKNFKFYTLIWVILLAAFNAIVFLMRPVIPGYAINYDARFWIAWAFILAAFIGNLACAYFAFQAKNLKRMFYNLPQIIVSWAALIAMLVAGCALMLIPNCPAWITAIVCILILAFNTIAVIKAVWAADTVNKGDEKVKSQTFFIRSLTVDAENLMSSAKSEEAKVVCKKVYEVVRYSDPMSSDALADVESQITLKFNKFSDAVTSGADTVAALADELIILLGNRSKRCRLLK